MVFEIKLGTKVSIIGTFQCEESLHALHFPISLNQTCVCLKINSESLKNPQRRAGGTKTKRPSSDSQTFRKVFFSLGVLYCTVWY